MKKYRSFYITLGILSLIIGNAFTLNATDYGGFDIDIGSDDFTISENDGSVSEMPDSAIQEVTESAASQDTVQQNQSYDIAETDTSIQESAAEQEQNTGWQEQNFDFTSGGSSSGQISDQPSENVQMQEPSPISVSQQVITITQIPGTASVPELTPTKIPIKTPTKIPIKTPTAEPVKTPTKTPVITSTVIPTISSTSAVTDTPAVSLTPTPKVNNGLFSVFCYKTVAKGEKVEKIHLGLDYELMILSVRIDGHEVFWYWKEDEICIENPGQKKAALEILWS